jgi:hypothetical protein
LLKAAPEGKLIVLAAVVSTNTIELTFVDKRVIGLVEIIP